MQPLPPYPNPWTVVVAAANTYADTNRKVMAAAAGLFSGNLHKPAAIDFRTVSQLARIVLIGDNFITIEVRIVALVVAEHFLHLLEGRLILRIEAQHFCRRQRDNELLAQGTVGRKALIYLYPIVLDFYIKQVFIRSCLQALIHFVDGNCFPSLQLVVGDVYLAFGCEGCDAQAAKQDAGYEKDKFTHIVQLLSLYKNFAKNTYIWPKNMLSYYGRKVK